MSKQALDAFRTKLSQDASLREELSRSLSGPAGAPGAAPEDLAAFARARGFEFTANDVAEHVELSDAELDQVAGGSVDVFLKLSDVKGESKDASHKRWIDLLSLRF